MNTFNKKLLYQLVLPLFTAIFTTNTMEHQQLQLEIPNNKTLYPKCSIMIPNQTQQALCYAMQTVHTTIFEHSNLQSTVNEPIMLFSIFQENSTRKQFYVPLPAKLFINCTDKSIVRIHESDASKLFKSHPIFKKKQLQITAICKKNPALKGNSFAEQLNNAMMSFYANPGFPWIDKEHEHELETAKIITRTTTSRAIFTFGPHGPILTIKNEFTFNHGPNGCPNEQTFIKLIIDKEMPYSTETCQDRPAHKNICNYLKNRETTGSFK